MNPDLYNKIKRIAEQMGQDPDSIEFQEGVIGGLHVKECGFCDNLLKETMEKVKSHAKEVYK